MRRITASHRTGREGFIVSIRKDVDTGDFAFPEGFDNGLRLKDFLEDEVDEKFYISQDKVNKIINSAFMQEKNKDSERKWNLPNITS